MAITLESVRSVRTGEDTVSVLSQLREDICNAAARLPVLDYQMLHMHLSRTSNVLAEYIRAIDPGEPR